MHTENIYHLFLFFGFIVALLFFNHSGDSIHDFFFFLNLF